MKVQANEDRCVSQIQRGWRGCIIWRTRNSDGLLDAIEGNSDGLKGEGAGKLEGLWG